MSDKNKEEIPPNHYRCAKCRKIFEKGQTEEEAIAEKDKMFVGIATEDCDLLCDDCYKLVMKHISIVN